MLILTYVLTVLLNKYQGRALTKLLSLITNYFQCLYKSLIYCFLFRIIAKIDDDMLKYYCNEDLFLLEIKQIDGHECFEVTLEELSDH